MTRKEFITKQETMAREAKKPAAIMLIVFLASFFGLLFAGNYLDEHKENAWLGGMILISLVILVIATGVLVVRFTKSQQKKFGMNCPTCNKPVTGIGVQIAIATGNCGHCGERVFETPAPSQ